MATPVADRSRHDRVRDGDLDLPLDVTTAGVTEIRVHGIGGATPAAVLDEPDVRQVTGDRISGMWRGADREIGGAPRWHREAYSWGGLTSRALTSALWLLLAPMAVVNMAGWMAVGRRTGPGGRPDWRIAFQQSLVRVVALGATWTYVLFVAQIAMDLGAWQCTRVDRCRIGDWPDLAPIAVAGHPHRAAAVAAVVPVLFVALLYLLTRVSVRRYEAFPASVRPPGAVWLPRLRLGDPRFWSGAAYANSGRWLHLVSSLVLVASLLAAVARQGGRLPHLVTALDGGTAALLVGAAVCAGWERPRALLFDGAWRVVACATAAAGLVFAGAALAWLQPPAAGPAVADPQLMPGMLTRFHALLLAVYAVGLLHGAVAAVGRWALRRDPLRPPRIPAPFTTMAVGVWLMFAVWAGATMWVARWLSPSATPAGPDTAGRLVYPAAYPVLAQLSLLGVALVLLVVAGFVAWSRLTRKASVAEECAYWDTLRPPPDFARAAREPGRPPGRTDGPETPAEVAAYAPTRWLAGVRRAKWWTTCVVPWLETGLAWTALLATLSAVGFSLWAGHRSLDTAGLIRVTGALASLCAGVTVLAWLTLRTEPPDGTTTARRNRAERTAVLIGWIVLAATAVLALALYAPLSGLVGPAPPAPGLTSAWVPREAFASALLTLIPPASVLLVREAIRNRTTRRLVGAAWDIATFWPRAFHPLAPPSYAERAIPELQLRVRRLLGDGHAVLLLGHSQGAVLVTAALAGLGDLPPDARRRLAAVTYGNPVRRLYMRWFPTYVDPRLVAGLLDAPAPRLVNFFRQTDPIGRRLGAADADPVTAGPAIPPWSGDCWLPDPPTDLHRPGDAAPRVRGHAHAGYVRQPVFADHVRAEVRRLNDLAA